MESIRRIGRPKTGKSPIVNFRSRTKLSGKEVKILVEDGKYLFREFKILALMIKRDIENSKILEQANKIINILNEDKSLLEVLKKWEEEV